MFYFPYAVFTVGYSTQWLFWLHEYNIIYKYTSDGDRRITLGQPLGCYRHYDSSRWILMGVQHGVWMSFLNADSVPQHRGGEHWWGEPAVPFDLRRIRPSEGSSRVWIDEYFSLLARRLCSTLPRFRFHGRVLLWWTPAETRHHAHRPAGRINQARGKRGNNSFSLADNTGGIIMYITHYVFAAVAVTIIQANALL